MWLSCSSSGSEPVAPKSGLGAGLGWLHQEAHAGSTTCMQMTAVTQVGSSGSPAQQWDAVGGGGAWAWVWGRQGGAVLGSRAPAPPCQRGPEGGPGPGHLESLRQGLCPPWGCPTPPAPSGRHCPPPELRCLHARGASAGPRWGWGPSALWSVQALAWQDRVLVLGAVQPRTLLGSPLGQVSRHRRA